MAEYQLKAKAAGGVQASCPRKATHRGDPAGSCPRSPIAVTICKRKPANAQLSRRNVRESNSQQFLRELDKKLWTAADQLRSNLNGGLQTRRSWPDLPEIRLRLPSRPASRRSSHSYATPRRILPRPGRLRWRGKPRYAETIHQKLEERDYYIEKNVFWVPALSRWKTLQDSAKLPPGTEIEITNGKKSTYKITSTGKLVDDALDAVEKGKRRVKDPVVVDPAAVMARS